MEVDDLKFSGSSKFTWRFGYYSGLKEVDYCYSGTFSLGSHKWNLVVYPNGNPKNNVKRHLSVYLETFDTGDLPYVEFSLAVVDQFDSKKTLRKVTCHKFTEEECGYGFHRFIKLKHLEDPRNGYIVDDVCVLEVEFRNSKEAGRLDGEDVGREETSNEEQPAEKVIDRSTVLSTQSTQSSEVLPLRDYPSAGQLFEDGKYRTQHIIPGDEKYEDIGGFKVEKAHALIYKKIWLKYGHIATSKILRDSYSVQVTLVSEIMASLLEINQLSLDEMSSEKIKLYEFKIKMAESFEFNVKWLRQWLENVKKDIYAEQKLNAELVKQDQCLVAAGEQLTEAKDDLSKIQEKLLAMETTIRTLLSGTQMSKRKVNRGLLLDGQF